MTKKRYYRNMDMCDNITNAQYYSIRDRKKEKYNVLFIVSGKNTSKTIIDLLNWQDEQIQELKIRNNRQYERLKEIGDLMLKRDWETLGLIVDKWEREEEQLRKYGG